MAGDIYRSARRLFGDGPGVGGDNQDEALGRGKGKEPQMLGDAISKISIVGESMGADEAPFVIGRGGTSCAGVCGPRVEAMEWSLGRIVVMLGMLMVVSGLPGLAERLAAEKRNGRMA